MNLYAIIPCYNEARSLHQSFPLLNGLLQQTSHILHGLLFINDGSSDTTKQELDTLKRQLPSPLKVQNSILDLPTNHGKAGAVFEGMKALKQTKNINDNDLVLLLDWDIIEPIEPQIITEIQNLFFKKPNLQMVIIGANEEYVSDTIMIEASGQRVVKFWLAYNILKDAIEKDPTLWYGLEELFNRAFVKNTYIYTDYTITTQPAYRNNNPHNSVAKQRTDYKKATHLLPSS